MPVYCLTMLMTSGGVSSHWTGLTSPASVRQMISAHSRPRWRASMCGFSR